MELRKATKEDERLLFEYRNEEETRKNSKTQELILWENHSTWFRKQLVSTTCQIYIAYQNQEAIGQIRIDKEGDKGIISYSIEKAYRKKGYGRILLELLEDKIKQENKIYQLEAEVKAFNKASIACFEKLGYIHCKTEGELLTYRKDWRG